MADVVPVDVSEAIAELTKQAQANPDLQGDTKAMLDRSQTLTKKSMVRSGGVALPDRVKFYRSRGGAEAFLPTAQLAYHLSKRHGDGTPVFIKERLEPLPPYIDDQCDVCVRTNGKPKRFHHRFDYVGHMESKHPREFRMMKEDEEKAKGPELASALMAMSPNERAAFKALLGGEEDATHTEEAARCDACGWQGKPTKNPDASLGLHERFHCPKRSGGTDETPSAV